MMDIQQICEEKQKAEAEILQILRDFTNKTGLNVETIHFTYWQPIGMTGSVINSVEMLVQL